VADGRAFGHRVRYGIGDDGDWPPAAGAEELLVDPSIIANNGFRVKVREN
jgi:hypothetical protein